jgi:hypothetical protein
MALSIGGKAWKLVLAGAILVVAVLISAAWLLVAHYDYNKLKPQIESAFKEATGRDLILKGNLDLKIGLTPSLVVRNAALRNAPWGSRPDMAEIKRFEVHLALIPLVLRHVEVRRIALVSPDILIETNPAGESNLEFIRKIGVESTRKEKTATGKVDLTINEIDVENGHITYRSGKTGETYVVMVEHFDASARSADNPLRVALNGSYNGKSLEVKGSFVPLAGLRDTGKPWPFSLTLSAAGASISLDGTIKDVANLRGFDTRVLVKSKDVTGIGEFLDKPVPIRGPLEMSCRLTGPGPKVYQISELKVTVSGSDLEGSLGVDISRTRPVLTGDLLSTRLDLRPFVGKEKTSSKMQPVRHKVFPDSPLPLEPLRLADVVASLKAAEVLTPQLALHNLSASLALEAGRLSVKSLTAVIGGGTLSGHFDLEPRGKAAHVETVATISRLDMGVMLRGLKETNILEGRVDALVNVSGRGDSIAGLMSGLTGTAYMIMGEGRINNRYIGLLGSNIGSNIFRMINPLHKESPTTELSCLVCGFRIGSGVAETTALVVNSDSMSVVGEGTINLHTEGLNFTLKPIPKEGIGTGITGKLGFSLGELARPFKLTGTLARPSLAIDYEQTAISVGKALGGFMLFGPAGLGGALVGESSSEKQLCRLAATAAREGVKLSLVEEQENKGIIGKTTQGVEKGIGEVEQGLKKLFGR